MSSALQVAQLTEDVSAPEVIRRLVDDLRQPLSSIAAIAYYVEMTLPTTQLEALHYLQELQALVDHTNSILTHAASLQNS